MRKAWFVWMGATWGRKKAPGYAGLELGMRDSFKEDLANHFGLELYADGGNVMGVGVPNVCGRDDATAGTCLHSQRNNRYKI